MKLAFRLTAALLFITGSLQIRRAEAAPVSCVFMVMDSSAAPTDVMLERAPEIVKKADPIYPAEAVSEGLQGRVLVKIIVDTNGKPQKAEVLRSDNNIFNQPSIDAAMKYRFIPAIMNGKPVAVWVVVPFTFRLVDSSEIPKDSIAVKSDGLEIRTLHYAPNERDSSTAPPEYVPVQKEPQIIKRVLPVYPENVLKDSIKAKIYVKVRVSATGTAHQVIVMKRTLEAGGRMLPFLGTQKHSYVMINGRKVDAAIFDRPTIDAAMKYRFTPAVMGGKPVAVWVVMPFIYHADGICSAPSASKNAK